MKEKKWYALRVISGKEKKCEELINKELENDEYLKNNISDVVLPIEKVFKVKKGRKYAIDRNLYPGYIWVEAYRSNDIISKIESLTNVLNFLKDGTKIVPLRHNEVKRVLNKVNETKEMTEYDIPFIVGENVVINEGPFKSFNGEILKINEDKKTVKLNVKIFERDTPIELSFFQIDKI